MKQLLVVSPESKLVTLLQRSLAQVESPGRALILRQYPPFGQLANVFQAKRPTTVIVGLSEPEHALTLLKDVQAAYPDVFLVAAHTVNSSDLILAAIRAGASEFLGPPFEVEHLQRTLSRTVVEKAKTGRDGRLVIFLPAHAGCGASTVALHVAAAISRESRKKVLLTDFDFHSGAMDFRLRLKPGFTLADALRRISCLDELWSQLTSTWKGIDVLPPPRDFTVPTEDLGSAPAVFASARRTYEYVIADLPPAIYSSCRDVLRQAEDVCLVCTLELLSLHLARRRLQQLRDLGISQRAVHLVVNRVCAKQSLSAEEGANMVGIPVAWTLQNDYRGVNAAAMKGCLVPDDSPLGQQFLNLARDIMGRGAVARKPALTPNRNKQLYRVDTELESSPQSPVRINDIRGIASEVPVSR